MMVIALADCAFPWFQAAPISSATRAVGMSCGFMVELVDVVNPCRMSDLGGSLQ